MAGTGLFQCSASDECFNLGAGSVLDCLKDDVLGKRPRNRRALLTALRDKAQAELDAEPACGASKVPPPLTHADPFADDQTSLQTQVHKVLFTGGPCAGKTTGIAKVRGRLEEEGFHVFTTPEAATMLFNAGCGVVFQNFDESKAFEFQHSLLLFQLHIERELARIARCCGKPAVLLCDRGTMDGRAFCSPDVWQRILDAGGWTTPGLCNMYDLVLHLVTAADGAEEYYTCETNEARKETPEQARAQDKSLLELWSDHPRRVIVDNNYDGFDRKVDGAVDAVLELVGVRKVKKRLLKYKLTHMPHEIPVPSSPSYTKMHVLKDTEDLVLRVYRHSTRTGVTYTRETLEMSSTGTLRKAKEELLTAKTYLALVSVVDPDTEDQLTARRVFTAKGCVMTLTEVDDNLYLYVEVSGARKPLAAEDLPEWIKACHPVPLGEAKAIAPADDKQGRRKRAATQVVASPPDLDSPVHTKRGRLSSLSSVPGLDDSMRASSFNPDDFLSPTLELYRQKTFSTWGLPAEEPALSTIRVAPDSEFDDSPPPSPPDSNPKRRQSS